MASGREATAFGQLNPNPPTGFGPGDVRAWSGATGAVLYADTGSTATSGLGDGDGVPDFAFIEGTQPQLPTPMPLRDGDGDGDGVEDIGLDFGSPDPPPAGGPGHVRMYELRAGLQVFAYDATDLLVHDGAGSPGDLCFNAFSFDPLNADGGRDTGPGPDST